MTVWDAPQHMRPSTRAIERQAGRWLRAHLPAGLQGPVILVVKLVWAALFAVLLLIAIVATRTFWPEGSAIARYDALVIFALLVQIAFLIWRLETWSEVAVIFLFHVTGTALELYKTAIGAWIYPEPGVLKLAEVPLFSGFMYAAVGSFLIRAMRVFSLRFRPFPAIPAAIALSVAIYVNFFTRHHLPDMRYVLFAASLIMFWRCDMIYSVNRGVRRMPVPVAALCLSVPLWLAETIGTLTGTWTYSDRAAGGAAPLHTLGSWYLLLYVSFLMVLGVSRGAVAPTPERQERNA